MAGGRRNKERSGWRFSGREKRAIVALIPLIAVLGWILWSASRPRFDDSATMLGDVIQAGDDTAGSNSTPGTHPTRPANSSNDRRHNHNDHNGTNRPATASIAKTDSATDGSSQQSTDDGRQQNTSGPFRFDPNTITYEQLRALGIAKSTAAGIVKYRKRGKVFQIPKDFATCYGITDSTYAALKPYIIIGEEFRLKPVAARHPAGSPPASTSAGSASNAPRATQTASLPQGTPQSGQPHATTITVDPGSENPGSRIWRDSTAPVDINTADSLTLLTVRGIGPRTASEIIARRTRLGGFHSVEQLAELTVVTEKNYELMLPEIWADSCEIQKIDINFALPNAVTNHPYMGGRRGRKILKNRQLKGGWRTIQEMIDDHTLTKEEAGQLAPYLLFRVQPREN